MLGKYHFKDATNYLGLGLDSVEALPTIFDYINISQDPLKHGTTKAHPGSIYNYHTDPRASTRLAVSVNDSFLAVRSVRHPTAEPQFSIIVVASLAFTPDRRGHFEKGPSNCFLIFILSHLHPRGVHLLIEMLIG